MRSESDWALRRLGAKGGLKALSENLKSWRRKDWVWQQKEIKTSSRRRGQMIVQRWSLKWLWWTWWCVVWKAVPEGPGSHNKRLVSPEMWTGVLSVKKTPILTQTTSYNKAPSLICNFNFGGFTSHFQTCTVVLHDVLKGWQRRSPDSGCFPACYLVKSLENWKHDDLHAFHLFATVDTLKYMWYRQHSKNSHGGDSSSIPNML